MKQLIPQSKIDKAADAFAEHRRLYSRGYPPKMWFNAGVQFALNEIQPLMVELADFTRSLNKTTNGAWIYDCKFFTTEQLLEQFLKTKTEWN